MTDRREPPARRSRHRGHDPHPQPQRDRRDRTCSATARRRSTRSPSPAGARSSRPSSTSRSRDDCCPSASAAASRRAAGDRRAGDRPPLQPALQAQLRSRHRLLPARLVHDEAQPEAARARRGAAGQRAPAPAAAPEARPGRAAADVGAAARARRGRGPPARLAAAQRRLARRARGRPAHARLPRGPRRAAHQDPHARHRARHEPGDGDDGAATRSSRSAPTTHGGVDLEDLRAKADDDVACLMLTNPNTLGALRPQHRGDRQDRPRRRRDALLRRREPQRGDGHHAPGRHGLRHRALQPAQVVHPAARRRRARRRPDRRLRPHRAVTCRRPQVVRREVRPRRRTAALRPRRRPPEVDRPPARLPGQLRRLRALLRLHPLARRRRPEGGVRDRGPERQLPAGAAARARRRRAPAAGLRPRCACTSSCSPARR